MRKKQKERLGTDTEKKRLRPIALQGAIKKSPKLR